MMAQVFLDAWQARFPQTPPIGFLFKHRLSARWARIHSLPGSKRYAQTPDERQTVLNRANELISAYVPDQAALDVVFNGLDQATRRAFGIDLTDAGCCDVEPDAPAVRIHCGTVVWRRGVLDPLLSAIADDKGRAFVVGPECLIAPYDGGIDVILNDSAAVETFKTRFRDWLSPRADGL